MQGFGRQDVPQFRVSGPILVRRIEASSGQGRSQTGRGRPLAGPGTGEAVARVYPSDITRLELSGAHEPELDTLRLLQRKLPDAYTVFHGVHWTREWSRETVFGELDFAVVNRAGKALLIEQKNGTLEETEDGLIASTTRTGPRAWYARCTARSTTSATSSGGSRRVRALELDYLVYCPAHRRDGIAAAGFAAEPDRRATERRPVPRRHHRERPWAGRAPDPGRAETVRGLLPPNLRAGAGHPCPCHRPGEGTSPG